MASGNITSKKTISAAITSNTSATTSSISRGGGTNDHTRLTNRGADDQHPISAITGLQAELDSKLDSETALPLIEEAIEGKAAGLYYDTDSELAKKPYWYLTSEIDPNTQMGTKSSVISGPYNLGAGGGGGGGTTEVTLLSTNPETGEALWPTAVSLNATTTIGIYWKSTRDGSATGSGTMYLYINDELVSKKAVKQGQIDYDITEYIISGENKIEFKVVDAYSTSKNLIGNITGVSLKLTSTFEDDISYTGDITYIYTPVGDVAKTVHFVMDGVDIAQAVVRSTGEQQTQVLPAQSHGAHTLQVYFVATLDGEEVQSNVLKYDLICYVAGNKTPIIASTYDATSENEQYVALSIPYRVYTPGKNYSTVYLYIDGEQSGDPLSVDISWKTWESRPTVIGDHIYKIQTGSVSRTFAVHVYESTIDVQPVTQNLSLYLTTYGRSNSESEESRKKWIDSAKGASCILTGFNWSSNGWVQNDDGETVLRLSGDARVEIPYQPFSIDLQQTGKTLEFEIATSDVKKYESRIVECLTGGDSLTYTSSLAGEDDRPKYFTVDSVDSEKFIAKIKEVHRTYLFQHDGTNWLLDGNIVDLGKDNEYGIEITEHSRGDDGNYYINGDRITVVYEVVGRGIYITPQLAKFQSQLSSLSTQYKENEKVRLAFVVEKRTENLLIYMYINGILSGVTKYPSSDTFIQTPAANITLGSNDATLDIYNIRIYDNDLTRKQIVTNWIADMRDPVVKATYYQDNDNFDETGKLVIAKLPSKTPYMVLTSSTLPSYKKDKKPIDVEFVYPGEDSRCFTSSQATFDVQGTSSQYYYRKNFKGKFSNGFTDLEGETESKYKINPPLSKKEKTFVFKADVASSEGANNVELVRYFEESKNWWTPAELDQDPDDTQDGYLTKDRIRVGIDGFPIVMFHNNGASTNFYGKMNFNNDKGNDSTFGFTDGDECWEFINNTTPLVLFKTDDMSSWNISFESRYPETAGSDEHAYGEGAGELDKLTNVVKWIYSTARFDTDTEAQKTTKLNKFRNEFTQYFDLQSSLFYYLYTELFLMVDSRAKNAMLAYLRTHQAGDGGNKWFWMPYDMDTAIGTNNEGLLVFDYDAEDTDVINGAYVYNGQQSTFWNNLRDAFGTELAALYTNLRSGNAGGNQAWSYDNIESMFENHQKVWSASIFNEDSYTKYLEPLILNNDATYLGMAQGSKAEQRKWWLYNRFKYLDSKYRAGDAKDENIMLRAYSAYTKYQAFDTIDEYAGYDENNQPYFIDVVGDKSTFVAFKDLTEEQKAAVIPGTTVAYTHNVLNITPYINCYVTGVFDQAVDDLMVTVDAEKDTQYSIVPPTKWNPGSTDSVVIIYSADLLRSIGDISPFKPGYADFSAATKLQRLQIGSAKDGYSNDKLTTLNVGNNHLLTYIDARNCSALGTGDTKVVNLSNCTSIEEVYFDNTNISGISLPVGGNLQVIHLPATITDLTIRNHPNLKECQLAGTSKLTSLWLEDIPSSAVSPAAKDIIMSMPDGSSIRWINLTETINAVKDEASGTVIKTAAEQIEELYNKLDTLRGKDAKGDTTQTAQITGTITVDEIDWQSWRDLSARYEEVKIVSDKIICTVEFYNYKLVDYATHEIAYERMDDFVRSVVVGKNAQLPPNPTFGPTVPCVYTFAGWDKSNENIQCDTKIYAIYNEATRQYTVTFDTNSELITADPDEETIDYNSLATEPVCRGVPETVQLIGWYNKADMTPWDFTVNKVLTDIDLIARWKDENDPTVELTRVDHKTINAHCTDNLGVVAYAVTNSAEAPTEWTEIESSTDIDIKYELDSDGVFFFHIKDGNDNHQYASIRAYPVSRVLNEGIEAIHITENDVEIGDFAINGTVVTVLVDYDTLHYQDLVLRVNGSKVEDGYNLTVDKDLTAEASCSKQTFKITFDTTFEGESKGTTPEAQLKLYKALVDEPLPQYDNGYYIDGWFKTRDFDDPAQKWDFSKDYAEKDATLYANWVEYHDPSYLTVNVGTDDPVAVNIAQTYTSYGVEVDWQDGSDPESGQGGQVSFTHTYAEAGEHTIKITCKNGTWQPGNSAQSVVYPSDRLTGINLAYDVTTFSAGAFAYCTSLTRISLSRYVVSIPERAFYYCTSLISVNGTSADDIAINLPVSVTSIGIEAFRDCPCLTGRVVMSKNLTSIGRQCFQNCIKITSVSGGVNLTSIGMGAFIGCTSLTSFEFSENLKLIPEHTFRDCSSLEKVDLPYSVTQLGSRSFNGCYNLQKVILRNPKLDTYSEYQSDRIAGIFVGDTLLESAGPIGGDYDIEFAFDEIIPDGFFANQNENQLKSVTLPETITKIGDDAFAFQVALTDITLPYGLNYIGAEAFHYCTQLGGLAATFDIPNTVRYIGFNAFDYTRNLSVLNIHTHMLADRDTCKRPSMIDNSWVYGSNVSLYIHLRTELGEYVEGTSVCKYYTEFGSTNNPDTSVAYFAAISGTNTATIVCDLIE